MAAATYAEFIAAVQAMEIAGVVRRYDEPPQKFNTADMPCSFVWFPSGDHKPLSFAGASQFRARVVDLIVVYAETGVTADMPFQSTVAMIDATEVALKSLAVGQTKPTWTIVSQLFNETADRRYWAVIATISGTG
jgi:hypothetical protein